MFDDEYDNDLYNNDLKNLFSTENTNDDIFTKCTSFLKGNCGNDITELNKNMDIVDKCIDENCGLDTQCVEKVVDQVKNLCNKNNNINTVSNTNKNNDKKSINIHTIGITISIIVIIILIIIILKNL